ncbi:hypothetical protein [Dactylosporangium sp. NPDC000521]|uniref:hypothetical protein n=1 Tax=Dactylosporangium sp. NPDC000521 TaxID=3363975 RepID=UPI0036A0E142
MPQDLLRSTGAGRELAARANSAGPPKQDRLLWFSRHFLNDDSPTFGGKCAMTIPTGNAGPLPRSAGVREMIAKYDAGELTAEDPHRVRLDSAIRMEAT